jgi:fatty-acyl-CoA synthase
MICTESAGTILDALARQARDTPHARAFLVEGQSMSFGQLSEDAHSLERRMVDARLSPGDRCAMLLPTSLDLIRLVYAVQIAGAIPVAIDPSLAPALRDRRLRMLTPRLVVTTPPLAAELLESPSPVAPLIVTVEELRRRLGATRTAPAPLPDDIAYLQLTSGTTGEPRAAAVSHRALLAALEAMRERFETTPRDIMAAWVPLYYTPGLVRYVFGTVYFGCQSHLIRPSAMQLGRWLDLLVRTGATITSAPDFAYRLAARTAPGHSVTLRALRVATNGGETVRASTIDAFERAFGLSGVVQPAYGLAEATLIVTSRRPGDRVVVDEAGSVSCGQPLAGLQVRIVADDGLPCAPGCEGEIQVRGDAVFQGYHDDDSQTSAVLRQGWLCTGDLGVLDERGDLYPRARARALIKRAGVGLAPREIEECVERLDDVVSSAAVGVARPEHCTEDLVIVVETCADLPACGPAIVERVTRTIIDTIGMAPSQVVVVPPSSIPRASSGKILHLDLKRLLIDDAFRSKASFGG